MDFTVPEGGGSSSDVNGIAALDAMLGGSKRELGFMYRMLGKQHKAISGC
jgi:hypothetical protein